MHWSQTSLFGAVKAVIGPNFGLDWVAIFAGFAALHFRCRAGQTARVMSMVANAIWLELGLRNGSTAIAAGNFGFLVFNLISRVKKETVRNGDGTRWARSHIRVEKPW